MSTRKDSMLKRKFSFDIPRLKIGPRSDSLKGSKDAAATEQDSPPQTPKSVRPPLSPKTDHQLRLACAYVLQDFKPSHQLYEEKYGKSVDTKPRLSYPVVAQPADEEVELGQAQVLYKSHDRAQPVEWEIPPDVVDETTLKDVKMKPNIKSQAFFEGLHIDSNMLDARGKPDMGKVVDEEIRLDISKFNPPIKSQAFFEGVDFDRIRKERIAAAEQLEPPKVPEIPEAMIPRPLHRSMSNPVPSRTTSVEPSRAPPRTESNKTSISTPHTEGTWNSSTVPTSAAITPARGSGSVPCSSHPAGSEKFLTGDIEWMRQELERHRRAQEEARARQELENQVLASLGIEPGKQFSPPISHLTREPLPRSTSLDRRRDCAEQANNEAGTSIQERRNAPPVPQLDDRQSRDLARSESKRQRSTPRSESTHELEMLRSESRQSRQGRRAGEEDSQPPSRSVSREIKDFFKGTSARDVRSPGSEMSRESSRSRRRFQVHLFRDEGTRAPAASIQSSMPQSRSRSIDSTQSTESSTSKWRKWKSSHRNQDSATDDETSRTSGSSKRHSRDLSREFQQSSSGRSSKPSVNLNRELPPLPSLDQWKPEEPDKPKHIVSMASPRIGSLRISKTSTSSEPVLSDTQDNLAPPETSHSAATSRIQSIYSRYSKAWADTPRLPQGEATSPRIPQDEAPSYAEATSSAVSPCPPQLASFEGLGLSDAVDMASLLPPSPAYTKEANNRIPSEYMFRSNFGAAPAPKSPPPIPKEVVVEAKNPRIPSEYMFRSNFGAVTVPESPPPVPPVVEVPEPEPETKKRETTDMFLPDLDTKARTVTPGKTASPNGPNKLQKKGHVVNYSRSIKRNATVREQSSTPPVEDSDAANGHARNQSEQINFSRKPSTDNYSRLYDMGYRNIVQIKPTNEPQQQYEAKTPPVVAPTRTKSKKWFSLGSVRRKKDDVAKVESPSRMVMVEDDPGFAPSHF